MFVHESLRGEGLGTAVVRAAIATGEANRCPDVLPATAAVERARHRRTVTFTWEDEDAQACWIEWCPFPDASTSAQDVDRIEAFLGLAPPRAVLDVGCGNGRHAVELARRGYTVVGIDVAARFLALAREAAEHAGVAVEFRHMRASALTDSGRYDVALAYWHTIGFMADAEIRQHFAAIRRALMPGGIFLYAFQGPKLLPSQEATRAVPVKDWQEKTGNSS